MRLRPHTVLFALKQSALRLRRRSGPRDLKRELKEQFTDEYWRRRAGYQSRRLWMVRQRFRLSSLVAGARDHVGFVGGSFLSLLRGFALGGLLVAVVLLTETSLARYIGLNLFPAIALTPPLGEFPALAAQVSASLLGFYLASVSIVLGNAYNDVSADVRSLVLGNSRTRLYVASIGMSIGSGLFLVLLPSLAFPYGYLTSMAYVLLVVFSGWAFVQLAFGAFNLFNPIVLGEEPLQALYRAIGRIDSKGLLGDEAVLQTASREANSALAILAHLIDLTSKRGAVDRDGLVYMVEYLLAQVQFYAQRKHLLTPTSDWFPREPAYPKWVESDYTETMLALETSMPLQPRMEPVTDWVERRAADLASAALETCVRADDQDATLRIIVAVASTAGTLARCYHLDDAETLARVVRARCWSIQSENAAAIVATSGPPLILSNILLGWREAIAGWGEEIRNAVASTDWDRTDTAVVQIRGPEHVWVTAQRLLRETQAEHELNERRATPDWYLHFALANACVFTIREFVKQLPQLLEEFLVGPDHAQSSSVMKAAIGGQALQALAKAELVVQTISQSVEDLERLKKGNDPLPVEELERLPERFHDLRSLILERIAEAAIGLKPERSSSEPDLFGQSLFTLVHYTEQAIASGDMGLVKRVFPKVLVATMMLEEHVLSIYGQQIHEYNPALFDPVVDLLEISGLAVIYEALRDDRSADHVREAWDGYIRSFPESEDAAKRILNVLDAVHVVMPMGITPRNMARTAWEQRLSKEVVRAGYARPEPSPFDDRPNWNAPLLIRMLSVSESLPSVHLDPRAIFAAEVVALLSGEPDSILRKRPGLKRYYEARDRHSRS